MKNSMKSSPYAEGNHINLIVAPSFLHRKKSKLWFKSLRQVLQAVFLPNLLPLPIPKSLHLKAGLRFSQKREFDLLLAIATRKCPISSLRILPFQPMTLLSLLPKLPQPPATLKGLCSPISQPWRAKMKAYPMLTSCVTPGILSPFVKSIMLFYIIINWNNIDVPT